MVSFEKEIEVLRKEFQDLSTRHSRLALIRFSLLALLVISFSHSIERINEREVVNKVNQIKELSRDHVYKVYIFNPFGDPFGFSSNEVGLGDESTETIPVQTEPTPQPIKQEPSSIYAPSQTVIEEKAKAEENARNAVGNKKEEANKLIEQLQIDVERVYKQAFRTKIPIPGSELELDLRTWIYSLPFLFILSEIYLFILRKQMRLLHIVAAYRIQAMNRDDVMTFDYLLFSKGPGNIHSFAQHPLQLVKILHVLSVVILGIYLIVVGWPFWGQWKPLTLIPILQILIMASVYSIAYASHVSRRLEYQVEAIIGPLPNKSRIASRWKNIRHRMLLLKSRIKPKLSLTSGSLLVFITLFLATATDACGEHRYKGYDIVRNPPLLVHDRDIQECGWSGLGWIIPHFTSSIYIFSLIIAALTLLYLTVAYFTRTAIEKRNIWNWLHRIVGTICLFVMADCCFSLFLVIMDNGSLYLLWPIWWLAAVFLWFRFTLSRRSETRARWPGVRRFIIVLYAPISVFSLLWIILSKLEGLLLYVIGMHLLWFGYMQLLHKRSQENNTNVELHNVPDAIGSRCQRLEFH